jgi:hypothetical protein
MQLDIGFGDVVKPTPVELPTLLDFSAPKLKGYSREAAIAEKFHAMVVLGTLNTRMKDLYDVWLLARSFEFDGEQLAAAIRATFKARSTEVDSNPIALTTAFAQSAEVKRHWSAFVTKSALTDAPQDFADVIDTIRAFVLPATGPADHELAHRCRRGRKLAPRRGDGAGFLFGRRCGSAVPVRVRRCDPVGPRGGARPADTYAGLGESAPHVRCSSVRR